MIAEEVIYDVHLIDINVRRWTILFSDFCKNPTSAFMKLSQFFILSPLWCFQWLFVGFNSHSISILCFLFLKMDCLRQFFFMSRVSLDWEMETTMLFLCYLHIDIIILTVFKNIGFIWSCPKKKVCGFWLARDCIRSSLHDMTKIF